MCVCVCVCVCVCKNRANSEFSYARLASRAFGTVQTGNILLHVHPPQSTRNMAPLGVLVKTLIRLITNRSKAASPRAAIVDAFATR